MQHLVVKDFCWGEESETLSRSVVVGLDELSKALVGESSEVRLARKDATHSAYGVFYSTFLPGRVGIAEEGLDAQFVELVMEGELGSVVESDSLTPCRGQGSQHLTHGVGDRQGSLARWPQSDQEAGVALVEGQYCLPISAEEHQVGLPVAWVAAISGALGTVGNRPSHSHEGGWTAPFAASPAPPRLGPGQVVAPAVVLLTSHLAVNEPIDALMGDDPIA